MHQITGEYSVKRFILVELGGGEADADDGTLSIELEHLHAFRYRSLKFSPPSTWSRKDWFCLASFSILLCDLLPVAVGEERELDRFLRDILFGVRAGQHARVLRPDQGWKALVCRRA